MVLVDYIGIFLHVAILLATYTFSGFRQCPLYTGLTVYIF
jgi:hypothetical protein